MRRLVVGREHGRGHDALEVRRHREAHAVEQRRGDVGDVAAAEHPARLDARAVRDEDAVRVVRADDVVALLDDRPDVLHRYEAEVAQHEQQVGGVLHRGARKHVLALVDLRDDRLAGSGIAQVLEIADQAIAHRFVVRGGDPGLARLARDADRDAVAGRGAAVRDGPAPVEVREVAVVAALARVAFGQVLPVHVALVGEVGVDAHDLRRAGEAVVRREEHLHARPGRRHEPLDEAVELPKVGEAMLAHPAVEFARLAALQRRIDERPRLVLQLVDAVEEHGHQVGRLLAHQVLGDREPLALALHVIAHPILAVAVAQLVARLLLLLEVPRELLRVEVRNLLQPVVQRRRVRVAPQMAPGHEAGHDEAVQFRRRRRGEREVQRGHPLALAARDRPDRLDATVARVVKREEHLVAALLGANEIEHAVMPGSTSGHQRHPRRRRERIGRGAQLRARALGEDAREERHDGSAAGRLDEVVQHGERGAVHADEKRAHAHGVAPSLASLDSTNPANWPSDRSPT